MTGRELIACLMGIPEEYRDLDVYFDENEQASVDYVSLVTPEEYPFIILGHRPQVF